MCFSFPRSGVLSGAALVMGYSRFSLFYSKSSLLAKQHVKQGQANHHCCTYLQQSSQVLNRWTMRAS